MKTQFETHCDPGGRSEDEKLRNAHEEADRQIWHSLSQYEMAPSERDESILRNVFSQLDHLVRQYGGEPQNYRRDKINIVRPGAVLTATEGESKGGFYSGLTGRIAV